MRLTGACVPVSFAAMTCGGEHEIYVFCVMIQSRLNYDQQKVIDLPGGEMSQRLRGSHHHLMKERK